LQVVRLSLVLPREPKIDQLDILVFIEEDVLEFEIAVDAGLAVDEGYGAD
jgi:hypothetical protein